MGKLSGITEIGHTSRTCDKVRLLEAWSAGIVTKNNNNRHLCDLYLKYYTLFYVVNLDKPNKMSTRNVTFMACHLSSTFDCCGLGNLPSVLTQ